MIEGETHGVGWRERKRKRGGKGVRHAGCMATQAALLYQKAPVGVFLPNSAEKPKAMPNSTSANHAAITSLIDVGFFIPALATSHPPCCEADFLYSGEEDAELIGGFTSSTTLDHQFAALGADGDPPQRQIYI